MTYKETIEYLYNSVPMFQKVGAVAYKEGLYNTVMLDEHFGHPHANYKTVHVAGTNGKGSCSHTIAAILQAQGYKVGLYTSPHLKDFRERIRVNGQCISEDYVVDFVAKERSFFEPLSPSFFELTTALAFKYFSDCKVDIAVIEVGLGGRLDCTNITTPLLSVITNISFDHTQFLGDTLAKIAYEKAGIIKKSVPVVVGESVSETRPVFTAKAEDCGAPLIFAEDEGEVVNTCMAEKGGIDYATKTFGLLHGELGGIYQEKNTETILCSIKQLRKANIDISDDAVHTGFANVSGLTGLLGRWQTVHEHPLVICDTGHNTGGWQYISRQLKLQRCRQMRIVFGMVDDKDIHTVMGMLPRNAVYYFTKADNKRAIDEHDIMRIGASLHLNATCYPDVRSAYTKALGDASADDFIFVGGSSYIVADFLNDCV